jgi:hypothetical protein
VGNRTGCHYEDGFGAGLLVELTLSSTRWSPGAARTVPRQRRCISFVGASVARGRTNVNRPRGRSRATRAIRLNVELASRLWPETIPTARRPYINDVGSLQHTVFGSFSTGSYSRTEAMLAMFLGRISYVQVIVGSILVPIVPSFPWQGQREIKELWELGTNL